MLKNRRNWLIRSAIVCLMVSLLLSMPCVACGETTLPFIRIDRDNPDYWKGELSNVRLIAGQLYELQEMDAESGVDPDFMPSEEGMDTLCISGSAQFSVPQFRELASSLRECAGDRTVYVFDLRQESHGLVNEGIPLSWYGTHNWANEGMTLEEVEADESERLGAMIGSTIEAYARKGETPIEPPMLISVESVMTEKELVESEGFEYIRLPIRDHSWPTAETIDTFVSFVKSIDPDQSWLHFHCLGGRGRTGVLMMIYDMMMNPDVPMQDIAVRQAMTGSGYVLYTEDSDSYKVPLYEEKVRMTPLFYEYVQQNRESNYDVPWSVWLEEQEAQLPAA